MSRARIAAVGSVLLVALVVGELALRVADGLSPQVHHRLLGPRQRAAITIRDEERGTVRGNPERLGHDEAGYRSWSRPERIDIVVLGDSQAYGPGAEPWPWRLAHFAARPVYSMALPGLGPVDYLSRLDEALKLRPRLIIVSVYLGDDFYDAYGAHQGNVNAAVPPGMKAAADAAERERPLALPVRALIGLPEMTEDGSARQWLATHVKLYALARTLALGLTGVEVQGGASPPHDLASALAVSQGPWRTILVPALQRRLVDADDPRIRVGFEVARDALVAIRDRARVAGVGVQVLTLPTKESVFWPHVREPEARAALEPLVRAEDRLRATLREALDRHGVPLVDALEPLRGGWRGLPPYPENLDRHPSGFGHDIVAVTVDEVVRAALGEPPSH